MRQQRQQHMAQRVQLDRLAGGALSLLLATGCVTTQPAPEMAPAPVQAPAPVPQPPPRPADDPPARVARLALIDGQVSFRPAADTEWGAAVPNAPVTTGDRLWSDAGSRAELDAGNVGLRLSSATELDVVRLDDHAFQVRIPQGTVIERVRNEEGDDEEIDAPNAVVVPAGRGEYRIDVSPDGSTTSVTVWSGAADVTSAGSSFHVNARQVATVRGVDAPTFDVSDAGSYDAFDRWSEGRDLREERAAEARRYVGADMAGTEDLDDYGRWGNDPVYGPVWYPVAVESGWAPYHYGHWVWVNRWGWTWVDDAPWGWAPFHYGRWAYIEGRWGWCPGRVVVERPVYAPALVVFVGGAGPEAGRVGWFPLGPEEVYRPAYVASPGYVRQVNVTNVTNITNITNVTNVTNVTNINNTTYRNRMVPGAVTVVPERALANAEPVRSVAIAPTRDFLSARPVAIAPAVTPTRASLLWRGPATVGSAAGVTRPTHAPVVPPPALAARPVMALHTPPPAPVPFSVQERVLAGNAGRPLAPSQVASLRPTAPPPAILPIRPVPMLHPSVAASGSGGPGGSPATGRQPASMPVPGERGPVGATATAMPVRSTTPPAPGPVGPQRVAASPLDHAYQAERAQMEARHRAEFAQPPSGESAAELAQRHEAEHQELEQRYQQARTQGRPTLPPAAPRPPATTRDGRQTTTRDKAPDRARGAD